MVTLRCDRLSVRLGARTVIDDLSLDLTPGRLIGVIGPNGAGKSTLLRTLVGLTAPAAGAVTIDNVPLDTLSRGDLARRVAYLPQGGSVHWPISVERLISLGRLPHLAPLSGIADDDATAIAWAMERTDTAQFRDRIASELSGGERARVLLARALAVEAPALLVDEPLTALDPGHQIDVMALLRREAAAGMLVIVVLHDLTIAARYCDRLILLHEGRLVADGAPTAVLTADRLRDVYGITAHIDDGPDGPLIVPTARSD